MSTHIKDENYLNIQGWMINKLGLKGNQLMVYAIIYGFSQDTVSMFTGTRGYLAEWIGASKETVRVILNELVQKNYLVKIEEYKNNIKFVYYKASPKYFGGCPENLGGGAQKSCCNNNKYNNKEVVEEGCAQNAQHKAKEYSTVDISLAKNKICTNSKNPETDQKVYRDLINLTAAELRRLKQIVLDNRDTKHITYREIQQIFNLTEKVTYDTPEMCNKLLKQKEKSIKKTKNKQKTINTNASTELSPEVF